MYTVKLFPGDTAIVNGTKVFADCKVTLSSDIPIERIPARGISDLPETELRIPNLWPRQGHRPLLATYPTP